MVCKEDVLSWFKDLESYKRIDVLYNLLNMCLPFELRFIGSCVEEIGKYTYQGLRGPALIANDIEKLSKDETFNQGLLEENVRHRVLLYISLLSSRNYSVANFLYKKLLRTDQVDDIVKAISKDELLQSETLLLFTMALYHPAFTFEQKVYFGEILSRLIHISETKRIAPKPSVYGYPPGFGYPTYKKSAPEISSIPVKSAPTMCYSDTTMNQQPPGLPQLPPAPHLDFLWSPRPGFHCAGAPEVPPFPPPSISPQVSQQGSPSHSRSASPHRTQLSMRPPQHGHVIAQPPPGVPSAQPPPPVATAQPVDCLGPPPNMPPPSQAPPMQMEQLSQSSLPMFQPEVKLADEELPSGLEEKQIREHPWPPAPPPQFMLDMKQNGLRFNVPKPRPFLAEQMQALSLDGENSLHYSNSSSNSSPNQTPPGTPSNTPSVTPHGPGRGNDGKVRNGIPLFGPPPMCDTTSPPPPPYSSVPFNYTPQFPPNRSLYPFSHNSYRPQYTGPYPTYQPTDNTYPNFTQSYSYVIYSSPSPFPPRNPPGCYNCGAPGHVGTDCTVQNIEEITQKKTYQLDYSSIMPDAEK